MMNDEKKIVKMTANAYDSNDFEVYIEKERNEMLRYIPQDASTILDVGCAVGSFGHLLKSTRLVEIWGVEVNEYAASLASQKLDKVVCGPFEESLNLPENKFDCIVFNDVLEHLVDPYSALIYTKKLLKSSGVVIASIPNVRYFDNIWKLLVEKDWQYTDFGILDRTHLRFFTQRSILSTFENLGYKVELIEGINPFEQQNPQRAKKFKFLNYILLNQIEDMRYLQFAVVALPQIS